MRTARDQGCDLVRVGGGQVEGGSRSGALGLEARRRERTHQPACERRVLERKPSELAGADHDHRALAGDRARRGRGGHECAGHPPARLRRGQHRLRAVGRGEHQGASVHASGRYSPGELPRSKPSMRRPSRSPHSSESGCACFSRRASSTVAAGITRAAPCGERECQGRGRAQDVDHDGGVTRADRAGRRRQQHADRAHRRTLLRPGPARA